MEVEVPDYDISKCDHKIGCTECDNYDCGAHPVNDSHFTILEENMRNKMDVMDFLFRVLITELVIAAALAATLVVMSWIVDIMPVFVYTVLIAVLVGLAALLVLAFIIVVWRLWQK